MSEQVAFGAVSRQGRPVKNRPLDSSYADSAKKQGAPRYNTKLASDKFRELRLTCPKSRHCLPLAEPLAIICGHKDDKSIQSYKSEI